MSFRIIGAVGSFATVQRLDDESLNDISGRCWFSGYGFGHGGRSLLKVACCFYDFSCLVLSKGSFLKIAPDLKDN